MGNGFNYVREIMQMNLPDTPVEKTVKAVTDGSMEGYSRYQFIGYMDDNDYLLSSNPKVVIRMRKDDHGTFQARAHAGDVIMHRNKLYAWCERIESFANDKDKLLRVGMWLEFNPGPCTPYNGPKPENKEEKNMAFDIRYLGESELRIYEGSTNSTVKINGKHGIAKYGDIVMSDGELYAFAKAGDDSRIAWRHISSITLGDGGPVFCYNKVKPNWLAIDKVVFNAPATIVFWKDGTKTIVKCGDKEVFDPEKGLAMAVTKKAFGNQGNYYNQIKKLLPKTEPLSGDIANPGRELIDMAQELIIDMTYNGATKAELVKAIKYSKELIDWLKTPAGSYTTASAPTELLKKYDIEELRTK